MSNEQSIRDAAAEWIAGLISGNGFGDDYVDDEVKQWANDLLASSVILRIRAEAWESGRKAGNRHGGSYAINPYRKEDR